jgi:hypothetical protein
MSNYQLHILNRCGYFCEWLGIALVLFFPLRLLVKGGGLKRAVLKMWMYMFLWSVVLGFIFPVSFAYIFHDGRAIGCFPDMTGIVPMAIVGWIPSFVICGSVWLVRRLIKRNHPK